MRPATPARRWAREHRGSRAGGGNPQADAGPGAAGFDERLDLRPIPAEATWPLRQAVLRPHQALEDCRFPGDAAPGAFHLGAFDPAGGLVAVASFAPEPAPAELRAALTGSDVNSDSESAPAADGGSDSEPAADWRLRGMATLPDWRGQGLGQALLGEGLARLASLGAAVLWCNARLGALAFYRRAGLIAVGPSFELPGIGPHRLLGRRVDESGAGSSDGGNRTTGAADRP